MKVRKNSISWYEPGRVMRANRKKAGKSLFRSAVIAALLGLCVALVLVAYKLESFVSRDALILLTLFPAAAFLVIGLRGRLGRNVALTGKHLVRVKPGSRFPRRTDYGDIRRCRFEPRSLDGEVFSVLQIFFASGETDEIELQENSDVESIAAFLSERGVSVETSA